MECPRLDLSDCCLKMCSVRYFHNGCNLTRRLQIPALSYFDTMSRLQQKRKRLIFWKAREIPVEESLLRREKAVSLGCQDCATRAGQFAVLSHPSVLPTIVGVGRQGGRQPGKERRALLF